MPKESGKLKYSDRAFRQDAAQAIRGDVIRALIELITNSDDAYGTSEGPIRIRVAPTGEPETPVAICVSDAATGLDATGLEARLVELGARKDDADSNAARGLFGRGARDVASLGPITFSAIRNGRYSALQIEGMDYRFLAQDAPATDEHRSEIGLIAGQNGFLNRLKVRKNIKVESGARLQASLCSHAQLRDLVRRREVFLVDDRPKSSLSVRLNAPDRTEPMLDTQMLLKGYRPVRLVLRRLPEPDRGRTTPYSRHGLLIRSGISVFENTWFDQDLRQESRYFAGEIDAPEIATIIRAEDRDDGEGGGTKLLRRDRDGLERSHPYTRALMAAVSEAVRPTFDALAKDMATQRRQGEALSNQLEVAKRALAGAIREVLAEIEDDRPEDDAGAGEEFEALSIIPPRRIVRPGEAFSLSLRASPELRYEDIVVRLESESPAGVFGGAAASAEGWRDHARLPIIQTTIHASAGTALGTAELLVRVGDRHVRSVIVVRDEEENDEQPPGSLCFVPERASVSPLRSRILELRGPLDLVDVGLALLCSNAMLITAPERVRLRPEPGGRWGRAKVRCAAGTGSGKVTLTATVDGVEATATLEVRDSKDSGGPDFDFQLVGHRDPDRRAVLRHEAGRILIEVFALHPSFAGVFGEYVDDAQRFAREDEPAARAVLAEVIGAELAGYLTERDHAAHPERLDDATRVLLRRADIQTRLQAVLHRALRPTD